MAESPVASRTVPTTTSRPSGSSARPSSGPTVAAKLKNAILRLQKTLSSLESRVQEIESAPDADARLDALENGVQAAMDHLDRHEDKINRLPSVAPATVNNQEMSDVWGKKLEALEARIRALETKEPEPAPVTSAAPDDLTAIKGIGPKYQRLLRQAGISTFAAIAAWSDDDVERVAKEIGVKSSRIRSLNWMESARVLVSQAG